jgi:radical SAM protein with 4Fe4S-binding SPASM domain
LTVEESQSYFSLHTDCFLVKGAKRGALYNLCSGDVFSIDPVAVQVVEGCEALRSVWQIADEVTKVSRDQILDFLRQVAQAGMGEFATQPIPKKKLDLHQQYEKLDLIWFELREDCNLRCQHCYCMSKARTGVTNRLTFEEWRQLLEEAAALGCRNIQFIGGEPFLFGDRLFDLAKYATELGYDDISVFSNLTILKDEWIDKLLEYKMNIACSLYAKRPEVHDRITTRPGSFERTMNNVHRLKERGIQARFSVTVMKHNQDYVAETMDFLREMGITKPGFDLVRPAGRGNDEELIPDKLSKKKAYRTRALFMQTDRDTFIRRYNGNSCWQGKATISSTGDTYPCIMQRAESGGNVRQQSLWEIIQGGLRKYWDLSYDKIKVCQDCEYRYACHDCRPITYGPTGELTAKSVHCSYDPYQGEFVDIRSPHY